MRVQLLTDFICVSCRADADFIRPSRNGRPARFGAWMPADQEVAVGRGPFVPDRVHSDVSAV